MVNHIPISIYAKSMAMTWCISLVTTLIEVWEDLMDIAGNLIYLWMNLSKIHCHLNYYLLLLRDIDHRYTVAIVIVSRFGMRYRGSVKLQNDCHLQSERRSRKDHHFGQSRNRSCNAGKESITC